MRILFNPNKRLLIRRLNSDGTKWLLTLLFAFGIIFIALGEEGRKTLWNQVIETDTEESLNTGKEEWQRPESKRSDLYLNKKNQSSPEKINQADNPKPTWERQGSERNDALLDQIPKSRDRKTLWIDEETASQLSNKPANPFDIEEPLLEESAQAKEDQYPDISPIKKHGLSIGPENLAQALSIWKSETAQQLDLNPVKLISNHLNEARDYLRDIKTPYAHKFTVDDSYLDIYSGPGKAYPAFYIAENQETVYLLNSQSGWYRVELRNKHNQAIKKGWIPESQVKPGLENLGKKNNPGSFLTRHPGKWFFGAGSGTFNDNSMIQSKLGYFPNEQLWFELGISEVLDSLAKSRIYQLNILHSPYGQKTISPFFGLGLGKLENHPYQNLLNLKDDDASFMNLNIGLHWYISDKYMLRSDFKNYVLDLNDDDLESHQEFSLGLSVFLDNASPRGIRLPDNHFIDRDDFEAGIFTGSLALEDFSTAYLYGALLNYHINESLFIEYRYAASNISLKNNDVLKSIFNTGNRETLNFYSLGVGLNVLYGEIILTGKRNIRSIAYINAAVGSTSFLDQSFFTNHFGVGVMLTPYDSWNIKLELQHLFFDHNIQGKAKLTNNPALQTGLSFRF